MNKWYYLLNTSNDKKYVTIKGRSTYKINAKKQKIVMNEILSAVVEINQESFI